VGVDVVGALLGLTVVGLALVGVDFVGASLGLIGEGVDVVDPVMQISG
jgi:hypothetical protein